MSHEDAILRMFEVAAEEMLNIESITLSANTYDQLLSESADRYNWHFDKVPEWFQIHGSAGYVKIVRGK